MSCGGAGPGDGHASPLLPKDRAFRATPPPPRSSLWPSLPGIAAGPSELPQPLPQGGSPPPGQAEGTEEGSTEALPTATRRSMREARLSPPSLRIASPPPGLSVASSQKEALGLGGGSLPRLPLPLKPLEDRRATEASGRLAALLSGSASPRGWGWGAALLGGLQAAGAAPASRSWDPEPARAKRRGKESVQRRRPPPPSLSSTTSLPADQFSRGRAGAWRGQVLLRDPAHPTWWRSPRPALGLASDAESLTRGEFLQAQSQGAPCGLRAASTQCGPFNRLAWPGAFQLFILLVSASFKELVVVSLPLLCPYNNPVR